MHRPTATNSRHNRRAMTLVELMLATVLAVAVMGSLSLVSASLRNDTADAQTRQTLATLRKALVRYHEAHGVWVTGSAPQAIETLLADDSTIGAVESLTLTRTEQGVIVLDGYGRPVRFQERSADGARQADFVSAGPDGRFGDPASSDPSERSAAMDNLYGSDTEGPR